jgi:hypothetical protein
MAYGMELYDQTGALTLSVADRGSFFIARVAGTVSANSSVNVSVSGIGPVTTKALVNIDAASGALVPIKATVGTNVVTITNGGSVSQTYSVVLVRVV